MSQSSHCWSVFPRDLKIITKNVSYKPDFLVLLSVVYKILKWEVTSRMPAKLNSILKCLILKIGELELGKLQNVL